MFRENIQIIHDVFLEYKGTGMYIALFLVGMLYIFLTEKNKNNKTFLVYFSVFTLLIILNPLFHKCINKLLNRNVYWRTFWILPMGIIMAYAATDIIKNMANKKKKMIAFLSIVVIIMTSGKFIYTQENYRKIDNFYKIPDEFIEVTNILSRVDLKNKKAMIPTTMVEYIRQIDANIQLAFSRRPPNDYEQKYEIVRYYNSGDVEHLTNLCKQKNTNIIVYDKSIRLSISPSYFEFDLYAQTEHYDIYVLNKNEE